MTGRSDDQQKFDSQNKLALLVRAYYVLAVRQHHFLVHGQVSNYGQKRMPRWDGGTDKYGRRYKAVWPKIADFILAHDLDPAILVKSVFARRSSLTPPTPNLLTTKEALKNYRSYCENAVAEAKRRFDTQLGIFQSELFIRQNYKRQSVENAVFEILRDGILGLSPLFRYCMACKCDDLELANKLRELASAEYLLSRKVYDEAWGDDFIPADLKIKAEQFCHSVSSK